VGGGGREEGGERREGGGREEGGGRRGDRGEGDRGQGEGREGRVWGGREEGEGMEGGKGGREGRRGEGRREWEGREREWEGRGGRDYYGSNGLDVVSPQVSIYKEDFQSERADRERAQAELHVLKEERDSLRQALNLLVSAGPGRGELGLCQ
jgi:hypothetical protein